MLGGRRSINLLSWDWTIHYYEQKVVAIADELMLNECRFCPLPTTYSGSYQSSHIMLDTSLQSLKDALARSFVDTKSFKHSTEATFKLSSGELSKFYVDCKYLISLPRERNLVAHLAYETLRDLPEFDCIGGLEIGSIAIASSISDFAYNAADRRNWPTFVVRKSPKEHGLKKLVEGSIDRGSRAVIVDDVLTSGGSVLRAVEAARSEGLRVEYALVIVDRLEQDGKRKLEANGIKLLSLLTVKDLHAIANPAMVAG